MFNNLPNYLTLARIVIIPVLVVLVMIQKPQTDIMACVLFIFAGITDYLDGKLARAWQQLSDLGRMMDPIADKLLVGILLIVMAGYGRLPYWGIIPAMIILSREILVSGLREYLSSFQVGLPVTRLSKWKTTFQMVAIGILLAGQDGASLLGIQKVPVDLIGSILLWTSAVLTIITGWGYVLTGIRFVNKSVNL